MRKTKNFIVALCFVLTFTTPAFAQNRVLSSFGNHPHLCGGTNILLPTYVRLMKDLREARARGDSTAVERLELAISILTEDNALNPADFGMVVSVGVSGPRVIQPNLLSIVIREATYPLVRIESSDVVAIGERLEIRGANAQVRIDFKRLGICQFAKPDAGALTDADLQAAVDFVLGRN